MVFHWSLNNSKCHQVSRTLLSILAVLKNILVWMVSTRPPTSKSSSAFSNPLVTVLNAPITIGLIVACMFPSFFNSLARSRYLSFFSHSFSFIMWSAGTAKSTVLQIIFFLLIIIRYGILAEIRLLLLLLLFFLRSKRTNYNNLKVFTSALDDGFSLEFEWQQVSRIGLRILAVLSNAVIWIVSTGPPTSKSTRPFNNPLVTVPKAPITIGIIVIIIIIITIIIKLKKFSSV